MPPRARSQRGFALTLLVLLAGLALTAMLAGYLHRQYSQQALSQALRANSEAQLRAWTGAELLLQYLARQTVADIERQAQDADTLRIVARELPVEQRGIADTIRIQLLAYDAASQRVSARITGIVHDAHSSLEAVYQLQAQPVSSSPRHVLKGGLHTGGYLIAPDKNAEFDIEGDVKTSGTVGVAQINATGSIDIPVAATPGGMPLSLWSNQDIKIGNGAFGDLKSLGNIRIGGGSSVDTAAANGWIANAGDSINALTALGQNTHPQPDIPIGAGVWLGQASAVHRALKSKFDVSSQSSARIAFLATEGSLKITARNANILDGWYRTALEPATPPGNVSVRHQPNARLDAPPVAAVPSIASPPIHAESYKDQANYRFYFSRSEPPPLLGAKIRVDVKNIHNIPDGSYYLGKHNNEGLSFICSRIDADDKCLATPRDIVVKFCSDDANAGCLNGSAPGSWIFKTKSHPFPPGEALPELRDRDEAALRQKRADERKYAAGIADRLAPLPGVILFEGHLAIAGLFRNTLLATGNIAKTAGGDLFIWSLSEAEEDVKNGYTAQGVCSGIDHYPTNHCAGPSGMLTHDPPQHIALLAGTFDDRRSPKASGGDISVTGHIYGSIMAGNKLSTSGSTLIVGFINALKQVSDAATTALNQLSAETTIAAPSLDSGNGSGGNAGSTSVKLLWSRYR